MLRRMEVSILILSLAILILAALLRTLHDLLLPSAHDAPLIRDECVDSPRRGAKL